MDIGTITNFFEDPQNRAAVSVLFWVLTVWSLTWKGFALYHAARQEEKLWFVAILIINLVGIPEILYLFYFSKAKISRSVLEDYFAKARKLDSAKIKNLLKIK